MNQLITQYIDTLKSSITGKFDYLFQNIPSSNTRIGLVSYKDSATNDVGADCAGSLCTSSGTLIDKVDKIGEYTFECVQDFIKAEKNIELKHLDEKLRFNPIIHICSSSEVYGLVTKDLIPIKEDCRFNPSNIYAVGKVGADMLALMYYTNYGFKTIRTRMFTHFSYRRKMLSAEVNFANQIARIEKGLQEPILKHGNLNSVRTWADARDAVKAYYLILTQPKKFGEVYNIGGQTTKTIGQMLDYMISLSPMKDSIIKEQDPKLLRPYDVTLQIPNCSKFRGDYPSWKPEITFEESIQDLLNEKRKQ